MAVQAQKEPAAGASPRWLQVLTPPAVATPEPGSARGPVRGAFGANAAEPTWLPADAACCCCDQSPAFDSALDATGVTTRPCMGRDLLAAAGCQIWPVPHMHCRVHSRRITAEPPRSAMALALDCVVGPEWAAAAGSIATGHLEVSRAPNRPAVTCNSLPPPPPPPLPPPPLPPLLSQLSRGQSQPLLPLAGCVGPSRPVARGGPAGEAALQERQPAPRRPAFPAPAGGGSASPV